MSEKVKFYRGNVWDRDAQNEAAKQDAGEIVFVNDAFNMSADAEGYKDARDFGSIYQDDKIVGTTKANELRLTQDLTVMGTNVGNITNNKTLEKGMSIEDILRMMLQKEVGIKTTKPTVSNFSVTPTDDVEVGSSVTVNLAVTYVDGKYDSADNTLWNPTELPVNAGCAPGSTSWTYNGVSISGPQYTFNAVNGDNKFEYTIPYGAATVTSVKNNLGEDVSVNITASGDKPLKNSKTIKGYYRWNAFSSDSNTLTKTETTWPFTKETSKSISVEDGKYAVVAIPEGFSLKSATQMGLDFIPSFGEPTTVTLTIGGTSTHSYKVYSWKNTSGKTATVDNITIG